MAQSVGPIARPLDDGTGGRIPVDAERAAGRSEVGVHEEEAEARVAEVLLDSAADAGARRAAPGLPRAPRAIGALGHPDALGETPEQPAVLGAADRELEPDALVAREQREEAVGRGRGDGLDPPALLQRPKRRDDVATEVVKEPAQAGQPLAPELHQRDQMLLAGRGERHPGLVAGHEPLGEERLHLADEGRTHQLIRQDRRDADGERRGHSLGLQGAQLLDQRQVGVERGLAEPVAAVRPAPVVEDLGQVTVQREDEVHRRP